MNYLSLDYGTKRVGLAYTINNIIFTLPQIDNNDKLIIQIKKIITDYKINKIFVGMSQGKFALVTKSFVNKLKTATNIPIETVEEAVSTIEASKIRPKNSKKLDSVSAAIILNRAISL